MACHGQGRTAREVHGQVVDADDHVLSHAAEALRQVFGPDLSTMRSSRAGVRRLFGTDHGHLPASPPASKYLRVGVYIVGMQAR